MKTIMICIAGFAVAMGVVASAAAGNSSLAPLTAASPVNSPPNKNMTFGVCQLVPNLSYVPVGGEHALNPASVAVADLWRFDEHFRQMPEEQRREALLALEKTAKVTILQQPTYGTLSDTARDYPDPTPDSPYYNPKPGYMGKDQVIFLVEMGEYKIKLIFNVYPVAGSSEDPKAIEKLCGKRGTYYEIIGDRPRFPIPIR